MKAGYRTTTNTYIGRFLIIFFSSFVVLLAIWNELAGPFFSNFLIDTDPKRLILSHRWITYEPQQYNPYQSNIEPDIDSIKQELEWIRAAGFDGIITFSSHGSLSEIPEIAHNEGLSVIMGVWDPNDKAELTLAISKQDYVDGYAVGHNGLDQRYNYEELIQAIRYIRFRTKLPVSTTEKIDRYLFDQRLLKTGDWLFPDAHISVKDDNIFGADARRDAIKTFDLTRLIIDTMDNKNPIMLKMITYPMDGVPNASLNEQAQFFTILLESRRDTNPDLPSDVAVSVHTAFDTSWKIEWPFYNWDPYTGLLDETGQPRPAVFEITKRLP